MNYKPHIVNTKFIDNKPYKIFCRNFLFLILFFEFIKYSKYNNDINQKSNFKIFIFKKRNHVGSFLRAPYKNKIAQFSLGIIRYYVFITLKVSINYKLYLSNKKSFNTKIKNLISSYSYFESTLVTQVFRLIKLPISINLF